jgi:cation transport protein ChaC
MNDIQPPGTPVIAPPQEDFWIFGYGSLMWDPGFPHLASAPALLRGYHRAFCIYSHRYRGTPERPGLVLGLDRGGGCRGRAFHVAAGDGHAVMRYLHDREMSGGVYLPRWIPVEIAGMRRPAMAFVADRSHDHYAGKLDEGRLVALIRQGHGGRGSNRHYLAETVRHLDELGIRESRLHRLLQLVEEASAAGPAATNGSS